MTPGELFGSAAMEALERTVQARQTDSSSPASAGACPLPAGLGAFQLPPEPNHLRRATQLTGRGLLIPRLGRQGTFIHGTFVAQPAHPIDHLDAILYANYSRCVTNSRSGGMVHVYRPERRLLSCINCTTAQAVFVLRVSGTPLAVQGTFIWALPLPEGVHQMYDSSPCAPAVTGHENPAISRQLADLCPILGSGSTGHSSSSLPYLKTGPQSEPGEKLSEPLSGYNHHWGSLGHSDHEGVFIPSTCRRHPTPPLSFPKGQE